MRPVVDAEGLKVDAPVGGAIAELVGLVVVVLVGVVAAGAAPPMAVVVAAGAGLEVACPVTRCAST
jgi:hypothetical protein